VCSGEHGPAGKTMVNCGVMSDGRMMKIWGIVLAAMLSLSATETATATATTTASVADTGGEKGRGRVRQAWGDIASDYKNFYAFENMGKLLLGLGLAGVLANTSWDGEVQDWYRESLRSRATDDLAGIVKPLGNGRLTVPVYAGAIALGELAGGTSAGRAMGCWGARSLRAILLGAPSVLFLQAATGGSRPSERNSRWRLFEDDNGVSGHSFVGAVPLLCAAQMTAGGSLKGLLFAASTLCGLSRINDEAHYLSQAALGWWMAYLACGSVQRTELGRRRIELLPVVPHGGDGSILTVAVRF
jgi:hypothetical protein